MWAPNLSDTGKPKYQAIADALEEDIRTGRLLPGDKLPPQRELADLLRINVSTVSRACREAGFDWRQAIAELIARHRLLLIEDDVYWYTADAPLPALSALVPEHGIFVAGLSKSYFIICTAGGSQVPLSSGFCGQ
jgi:DNA-binding transcriptional MocR family regulator